MDFSVSLFDNCNQRPLICAHRGLSGGNIPCNTRAAFNAALLQHADMIELDVSKSRDGEFYVFHPGMEHAHLNIRRLIQFVDSSKVDKFHFVNQDNTPTQFGVNRLEDILDFLKGKCYINVDKFWTDIEGISSVIRRCGVEKQVIVKSGIDNSTIQNIRKYAPDFMFLPIVRKTDNITERLISEGINCVGAEILFSSEDDDVCSDEYISMMHDKKLVLFANAIVYNYKEVLSAYHNDDTSLSEDRDKGWGWLIDKKFDIIQTDWCGALHEYISDRAQNKC